MSAVVTGTTLTLLLISDLVQGSSTPSVWSNLLLVLTAVLVLSFVSLTNRERLERGREQHAAEQDLAELRHIRSVQ